MNTDVLPCLRCPVCGLSLSRVDAGTGRALRCPRNHSFDIARQGYVNLNAGRTTHVGDTAEMVAAREEFLAGGHFDFLSAALREAALRAAALRAALQAARRDASRAPDLTGCRDLVVDVGAGTGRHLAVLLDALPTAVGLALDISKPALRRAARVHPRAAAVRCDTWGRLPLADRSAALLLNVFAPRNGPEFRRVLRPDGALLVVTPATEHLHELVGPLGLLRVDPTKTERVIGHLGVHFDLIGVTAHRRRLMLRRSEVQTLIGMGPSAWHIDPVRLAQRIAGLPEPLPVTASVRLATYRPR